MRKNRRRFAAFASFFGAVFLAIAAPARAEYSDRPAKVLPGLAASGGGDIAARHYVDRLRELTGAGRASPAGVRRANPPQVATSCNNVAKGGDTG